MDELTLILLFRVIVERARGVPRDGRGRSGPIGGGGGRGRGPPRSADK